MPPSSAAKPISAVLIDEWRCESARHQPFSAGDAGAQMGTDHHHRLVGRGAANRKPRHLQLRSSLVAWSKTLSSEVATVNVIPSGRIDTERVDEMDAFAAKQHNKSITEIAPVFQAAIPMGRYSTVEEFAAVAAFLASNVASHVTGSLLRVDGRYIRSI
jgi:NAD(P)-dependent dehydrogenase (short-subunit alcohol dehydrogenase family)